MHNETKQQIIDFIDKNGPVRPSEIARHLNLSLQNIHWHLRKFKADGSIQAIGAPPKTHYIIQKQTHKEVKIPEKYLGVIEQHFSYLAPQGALMTGVAAFTAWLAARNLENDSSSLSKAYFDSLEKIYSRLEKPFSTIDRLQSILNEISVDEALVSDFYALPQFGKTYLGNMVHAAKTTTDRRFAKEIAKIIMPDLQSILKTFTPSFICFVPHSVPRKVQFLPELESQLKLSIPKVTVNKLFFGSIPVAQKSLSKTSERIENAEKTFAIPYGTKIHGNVLLIDDAIGSGATINAIAKMLKKCGAKKVIGYAIVGSYKGFDVLPQV